jgi:exonuclease III
VTERSWPLWRAALEVIGLPRSVCGLDGADPARQPAARRRGGVLLAAREPLSPADPLPVPRQESAVAARIAGIEIHTAHVPNAANGWVKPDTLRALRAGLEARSGPAVLCGDLNTPRREHPDGSVISFARDSRERLREERGTEWDEGELCVVPGLAEIGWTDCFRALRGYAAKEPSWTYPRGGGGYRLDHVFCSPALRPLAATYHHGWRDAGLSDHSALEADLGPV